MLSSTKICAGSVIGGQPKLLLRNAVYSIQQDVDATRRLVITLSDSVTVQQAIENPEALKSIMAAPHTKVSRGDFITLVSKDGRQVADSCPVMRADGSGVWLCKPLRLIDFEEEALFSDDHHEVVPSGTGYAVRNKRSHRDTGVIFSSQKAAEAEVLRRQTKRAS